MLRIFNPRSSELSDEELLGRYQATGELAWLGQLFERYAELVYGVCLKYCRDEQEAEDAHEHAFVGLGEALVPHLLAIDGERLGDLLARRDQRHVAGAVGVFPYLPSALI